MIMPTSSFSSDEQALNWARQYFQFSKHTLIRDIPWSRIFVLHGDSDSSYLKIVPLNRLHVLKTQVVLSQHFNGIVPGTFAINEDLGYLLIEDHGGQELGTHPSEIQSRKLVSTYAQIQTESLAVPEVIASVPVLPLNELLENFLQFLKPDKDNAGQDNNVNADFFLGVEQSQEYYDVFLARKDLLQNFLKNAAELQPTLNHCDLHSENAAEKDNGASIIYDWDDALIGPAGLSLHAIFVGCYKITRFLNEDFIAVDNEADASEKRLLSYYISELAKRGYASVEVLQQTLPATACAGAIQALLTYGNFPQQDKDYIANINEFFVRRLDDLLNLCDYLSCSTRAMAINFAKDYQERKILFRAAYVYRHYIKLHPNDIEIHKKLASTLNAYGKWESAIESFQTIIEKRCGDAEVFNGLGMALLKSKKPADALIQFELALSMDPDHRAAKINRAKASELLSMIDKAQHPNKLPTIAVSEEERSLGCYSSEKTELAYRLFKQYGALVVENVFDTEMLQAIKKLVLDKYAPYFEPKEYDDCLVLGDKRHMVTLGIEGPINSPNLYDNPYVSALVKKILCKDFILGGLNIGVSLPGADHQSIHKDHSALFYEDDDFRENTPSFAIGLLIPLVQHSHTVGTTLVIKGSHKTTLDEAKNMPGQEIFLDIGSCLMIDYRVAHQGLANKSNDVVRPLLTLLFHRSWFRDCFNYQQQAPIKIADELFEAAPARLKELISWSKTEAIVTSQKNGK